MDNKSPRAEAPAALLAPLDQQSESNRLARLEQNIGRFYGGDAPLPKKSDYVNNHIHTTYSFSPYTPGDAVYRAWLSGLTTAGIMDHDSVAGAGEFVAAGAIAGLATTVGFECRCSMGATPFAKRRLNNPDQTGVAYVACHGIPHQNLNAADRWLAPYRDKRDGRNKKMLERINERTGGGALALDYERDVVPLSMRERGGSVTERHLLYALALRIVSVYGKGQPALDFLADTLGIEVSGSNRKALADANTPFYGYALLGALKSGLVEKIYIDAADECPAVAEFVAFARSIGAIPAYAYLGDVEESVTGDKRAQRFEDAFLGELVPWLAENGFCAITYMPTRNSAAQLKRVMALCESYGLFQISGEDINSPTQSFICKALDQPEFKHLITNTWALIGHEKAATNDSENGMFSDKTIADIPNLKDRIKYFAELGKTE